MSVREVPLESQTASLDFVRDLLKGEFDLVVFVTGVSVRALMDIAKTKYEPDEVIAALHKSKDHNSRSQARVDASRAQNSTHRDQQ